MLDITQAQFATSIDTFKNEPPNKSVTISVPSQSYTSGQTRTFSGTVELDRDDATTQVLVNFSFEPTREYTTRSFLTTSTYFITFCSFSVNDNTLTATVVVSNGDASTRSVAAYTVTVTVKKFVAPFS